MNNYEQKVVVISQKLRTGYFKSFCESETEWRREGQNKGTFIKSWIRSIAITSESKDNEVKVTIQAKRSRVMEVGNYSEGKLNGLSWRRYCYDCNNEEVMQEGWLYGKAERGEFSGSNIVYLYPDLYTVLIGHFQQGRMVQAKEGRVVAYRCRNNMVEIKYAAVKARKSVMFSYDPINEKNIHKMPTTMDPYERRMVWIGDSKLAENIGEGVFAKRDLRAGEIILFFSGVLVNEGTELYMDNMTISEREDILKNFIRYDNSKGIDVPPYYSNILTYRATLGHKVNHNFISNAMFSYTEHPRFGSIKCVKTWSNVHKGEELTVSYNYKWGKNTARWYKALLHQILGYK